MGRDFCFIGSEVPLQVGHQDFALDLLFFHRGLNCLVAVEMKVGRFAPEYLGKLNFYLEDVDRDVRKPHERPTLGLLLCASKDDEVVEYALRRSLSPAMIAEYKTQLPDKRMLAARLRDFYLRKQAWTMEHDRPPHSWYKEGVIDSTRADISATATFRCIWSDRARTP